MGFVGIKNSKWRWWKFWEDKYIVVHTSQLTPIDPATKPKKEKT